MPENEIHGDGEVVNAPLVVGFGGTAREGSSSARALAASLAAARMCGARTVEFTASDLSFPMYGSGPGSIASTRFVNALRDADGVIIASPGYHGGVSGIVKNAIDYLEELREDARPYLDGRAVGCICCAHGWQATTTTLISLRSMVHALRGWPTPLGVAINSGAGGLEIRDAGVAGQLRMVGEQVVRFAESMRAVR